MKLLTKEIIKKTPKLYEQDNIKDKTIYAKFFDPCGSFTWYVAEMDKENNLCFGYVDGFESEWGYFSIDKLESIKGPLGLGIERDIYFKQCKFSEIQKGANK